MVNLRRILESKNSEYYAKFIHIEKISKRVMPNVRVFFPKYTNHDIIHLQNVEENANKIITEDIVKILNDEEIFCLLSAIWLHDIGMIPIDSEKEDFEKMTEDEREKFRINIREKHNIRSSIYVNRHKTEFNLDNIESKSIGNICKGHRSIDLNELTDIYSKNIIRIGPLAAILRLADECDISKERETSLSKEGIDEDTKEQHYSIHDIVKAIHFNHENHKIIIVGNISQEEDKTTLINSKNKITEELNEVHPFLEKINIELNEVIFQTTISQILLKKRIILCIAKNKDVNELIDEFNTQNDIDDELDNLITTHIINPEFLTLTEDYDKFKEIFKLFSDKNSIREFYFTDYVQNIIPKLYSKIENNFNVDLELNERTPRINILKKSPTSMYFLLFMEELVTTPNFNTSSNQNGALMLDSILLFGLFNDIYHYANEINFDKVEEIIKSLKIFDLEYILMKINGCKELGEN